MIVYVTCSAVKTDKHVFIVSNNYSATAVLPSTCGSIDIIMLTVKASSVGLENE